MITFWLILIDDINDPGRISKIGQESEFRKISRHPLRGMLIMLRI